MKQRRVAHRKSLHPAFWSAVAAAVMGCAAFTEPPESPPPPRPEPVEPTPQEVELPPVPTSDASPEPASDPTPPEPGILPSGGPSRGTLPKAAIERGVRAGMSELAECHRMGLERNPALSGQVLINFVVAPDGTVPYAAALETGTNLPDDAVVDCVLERFHKLVFDAPVGGRAVVTYPLTFSPREGGENAQP